LITLYTNVHTGAAEEGKGSERNDKVIKINEGEEWREKKTDCSHGEGSGSKCKLESGRIKYFEKHLHF